MRRSSILFLLIFLIAFPCFLMGQDGAEKETKFVIIQPTPEVYLRYAVKTSNPDVKHGAYKCRWKGKTQVTGFYFNNQLQGVWEHFYPNGNIRIRANYLSGKKHGKWEYFFQNGKPQATVYFVDDKPSYNWRGYHPNGEAAFSINYKVDSVTLASQFFYPNGKLAIDQLISVNDSVKTVRSKKYYGSGILYESGTLVNDKWHGHLKRFHYNSVPWEDLYYHHGQLMEIHFCRNSDREDLEKGSFENGNGEAIRYHADGTRYSLFHYRNGFPDGKAVYYRDEKVRINGFFRVGKPSGRWEFYNRYYKLFQERDYFDGTGLVYERIFSGSGKEGWDGEYLNGYKDGVWTKFNFYGEAEEKTSYKLGYKHGTFNKLEGVVKRSEGGYYYGEKVGQWKYYNSNRKLTYRETFMKEVSFDSTSVEPADLNISWTQVSDFSYDFGNTKASFPGGRMAKLQYLESQLKWPEEAEENEVSGTIIVKATISELGEVTQVRLVRGIGFGCDQVAVNAIKAMPFWNPEFQNGLPVESTVDIFVVFAGDS